MPFEKFLANIVVPPKLRARNFYTTVQHRHWKRVSKNINLLFDQEPFPSDFYMCLYLLGNPLYFQEIKFSRHSKTQRRLYQRMKGYSPLIYLAELRSKNLTGLLLKFWLKDKLKGRISSGTNSLKRRKERKLHQKTSQDTQSSPKYNKSTFRSFKRPDEGLK